ncbi:glycogen/starch/alpha-glucan phosphorylase [Rhodospirillum rubrum]|uniref:Alpha-1,4 glucan phosphorylase n=1 Tax=Rhodospirillum rubrum (strain ATCC 11170 / ATH 1.1.1 / DSM 467 / LMG 4362 / NCIMB 8255 / S1) TaxID=269796 RepID=Q2RS51_RHORT|nr:glycogen/starch/alpha-glucan phosphorylase [Rhodospirillum rubrum]ABC23044.1 Glycogen/starch/alpha-glucan phosphorylase [Rhodospirillum rubrum ATCC 11170]AEO48773.1 glycogen/starch/alpha-glucan phosphorylase [Rhodospirillum rubrum F11]MBK5954671.1 glycogen phosphorylase [Rhodospirillum rubrum]QXG79028.1 glycogen/starch/alpha-glucan phosphorylase [Rhodospirillum rubrum]HAP99194.1 glycogen/starch/alpha-glucan phosphorylase [Rhodospirillum rubrum]
MDTVIRTDFELDEGIDFTDVEQIKHGLVTSMVRGVGFDPASATEHDWFLALASLLRGHLSEKGMMTSRAQYGSDTKRVYYLSLEFLTGRRLVKHLLDLGIESAVRAALRELGQDLDRVAEQESDAALGNGGLGRLAACFLDSMATHGYPGYGYGIRYEFGMFSQTIENGQQVEHPESWLRNGNPWEIVRHNVSYPVRFGGHIVCFRDEGGEERCRWVDANEVIAEAYDLKETGYGGAYGCNLRLWSARATQDFDLSYFNEGNYIEAVKDKTTSENLSKVLYPMDTTLMGQELRLKQEYFFVSASLQDILARFFKVHKDPKQIPAKIVIQLNDTHPALAVPEMMRLLMDNHALSWDAAWDITRDTFAYTNHTLLPEALETWPVAMLEAILPRHLEIIYKINYGFLQQVRRAFPGDVAMLRRMSLIDEDTHRVRMAHLAVVGSRRVNGVAALHTKLLRERVFPDFDAFFPEKFVNVTNGITQRRWLLQSNPPLAALVSETIGEGWLTDLDRLRDLEKLADDPAFQDRFLTIKAGAKARAAALIAERCGVVVSTASLFDIQIKRIHEYKRQLLNIMQVIARYNAIRRDPKAVMTPRTVIFGGKAAPGYYVAKKIIRLINDVAETINHDPAVRDLLKVVFVPNYNVSTAEILIPSCDLSEQISTAGTEASGTGNMKFALNGALTIGTLDGANIEIREEVGDDNIFIFGHTAQEVSQIKAQGYDPWSWYAADDEMRTVIDMIRDGFFSTEEPDRYRPIADALLGSDTYLVLADFRSYMDAQKAVDGLYTNQRVWARQAILNIARVGKFSSDRAIHTYAKDIWGVRPMDALS